MYQLFSASVYKKQKQKTAGLELQKFLLVSSLEATQIILKALPGLLLLFP